MGLIGIDSHKDVLGCAETDENGRLIDYREINNTIEGHAKILCWITTGAIRLVAIEGSGNYGRPLAKALAAHGVSVVEVPPQMTAAARKGMRTGTKNDLVDAVLIAQIALRVDDLGAPKPDGPIEDLRNLVQYRRELVQDRNRAVNRLHSDLEQIRVGYHRDITTSIGSVKSLQRCRNLLAKDRSVHAQIARKRITTILGARPRDQSAHQTNSHCSRSIWNAVDRD